MKIKEITTTAPITPQNFENFFNVYQDSDGFYFFNLSRTINFPDDLSPDLSSEYIILPKDTWTGISFKHYNTIKLWWLVCLSNKISNPIIMPTVGSVIKILNKAAVEEVLNSIRDN